MSLFFLGLTVSFILLIAGVVLLIKGTYLVGGILLGAGILFLLIMISYYRSRRRGKSWDCGDCSGSVIPDCSMPDCDGPDCDCSPDCSI